MMQRRFARMHDDDLFDDEGNGPYDKRYPGQRVIADKGRVGVPIQLTDGMPDWMPPRRPTFDASQHRPHQIAVPDSAELRDARRLADAAYDARSVQLENAWRGKGDPPPPPLRDGESPRDAYIRRLGNAWKALPDLPARDPDDDDDPKAAATAVEAQRRRWNAEIPAKDAALADRDIAYGEYLDYLQNAWKRPCGVVAGGKL